MGVLTIRLKNTGTLTFTASASATSESPYVTFPRGKGLTFSTTTPFKSATGSIVIGLKGAPVDHVFDIQVSITADNLAVPGIVTVRRRFNGNYDVVMASSATDNMSDSKTVWTVAGDTKLDVTEPWVQLNDDGFGRWSIPDHNGSSDQYLISPALQVKSSGNFGFSLRHRYSLEYDTDPVTHVSTYYDGAVIELSADNGVTWTDIGKSITANGYPGTVWTLNDVLYDRKAFVGPSPGYPAFITSTADLGAAYQGKSVKLRFRVGTDDSVGAPGWDLDELQVSGIDNTPFPSHQASLLSCGL
jgi:hypothetical protein